MDHPGRNGLSTPHDGDFTDDVVLEENDIMETVDLGPNDEHGL
jgi:hypothetical protein